MKKIILLFASLLSFNIFAETGILFIAHGTMGGHGGGHQHMSCTSENPAKWESYVLNTINGMKKDIPLQFEVTFGMWESHCFDQSIAKLDHKLMAQGKTLDHLIVFPLFISSFSSVTEMQKYIFKKRADRVLEIPGVHQTQFEGKITYMNAFDYEPHISMILANRLHHLVHMAKEQGYSSDKMEVVLVMHGPVEDEANQEWMKMGEKYNRDITYLFPVTKSHVISLRDDADQTVKDEATKKLRNIVSQAKNEGKIALILPLLIARGGIDAGIVKRLNGLSYIWSGESLFPDPKLKDAILHKLDSVIKK